MTQNHPLDFPKTLYFYGTQQGAFARLERTCKMNHRSFGAVARAKRKSLNIRIREVAKAIRRAAYTLSA